MTNKQTQLELQSPDDASPVVGSEAETLNATTGKNQNLSGLSSICNSEERLRVSGSRLYVSNKNRSYLHTVFVLSKEGTPLTPTTPAKARKLLKASVAKPVWSKFNTFGIQLLSELSETRQKTAAGALGVDNGTKFEGYSVIVGHENSLNVKLDLPDKKKIVRKLEERRILRRARRHRNCRRREARFDNRSRKDFLAPSQAVIVNSRLRAMRELFKMYPINLVGFEDVRFNHSKKRWGKNFSTVEIGKTIGKTKIKEFFKSEGAKVYEYRGYETKNLRQQYGYRKTSVKSADKFTVHCSDSLALAVDVSLGVKIEPGPFLAVDDFYRPVRRKLHDTQPAKGGIRQNYSSGSVLGFRKGILVGTSRGKIGELCGENKGSYRYYDKSGKRQCTKRLLFACGHFVVRGEAAHSSVA